MQAFTQALPSPARPGVRLSGWGQQRSAGSRRSTLHRMVPAAQRQFRSVAAACLQFCCAPAVVSCTAVRLKLGHYATF